MTPLALARLRGLRALVEEAVDQGSRAVERVERETVRRPLELLALVPALAAPARVVGVVHDASVAGVHLTIRGVNRLVGASLDLLLDGVEAIARPRRAADQGEDAQDTVRR